MKFNLLMKCCLDGINKLKKPIHIKYQSKIKYDNQYYLTMIFFMLNDVNNWKFLSNLKIYKSNYKYHYKTIYNKFCVWTSLNVFKNAFYNYKTIINMVLKILLSIIYNKQGFIYSVIPFDIKNINIAYSTSVHDVKMIKKSIDEIKDINNNSKYYNLIADKVYKTMDST